ncbi:molybdate ABC transporter substrate-binding protein [Glaciecola sp. MF2-115]|uniref:molybdate ABC transporter substrate-binding protein n=1 Tax=Glaciecola sp. MF2-115 TaxID=3384827 RepID=UPI0039A23240
MKLYITPLIKLTFFTCLICISSFIQASLAVQAGDKDKLISSEVNYKNKKAGQARIAVASNFIKPMQQLSLAFEKQSGHSLIVSYSASGKLYAQIVNGAPYDVFLSADQTKPEELIKRQKAKASHRFTYAIGKLILWSSDASLIDGSDDILVTGKFRKVALANPKFAPYGLAALSVLENLNLKAQTKVKWVLGESISQTYQFVATGNADIGFISYSQLPESGSFWEIPNNLYAPIKQDVILLNKGENNPAAIAFFAFLKSNEAKNIIQSHHYNVD